MTVSRVVNGSGPVSPRLRSRVERALAETGYIQNTVARNLRTRRTDAIALVLPDMTNPFFTTLAHGVEAAARESGISLLLANSDEREDEERRLVPMLLQRQVDGLLIVPAGTGEATVHLCRDHGVPLVVVDRRPQAPGVDVVRADSEGGAEGLGRLLVSLGHRRVAVLSGPASVPTAVDRVAGFCRAFVDEAGLPPPQVVYGAFSIESGHAMALSVVQASLRPTAHLRCQQLHRHRRPARTRGARPPSPRRHGGRGVRSICRGPWSPSPSSRWLPSPRSRWVVAPSKCSSIASRIPLALRVTSCCPRSSSSGARAAAPSQGRPPTDPARRQCPAAKRTRATTVGRAVREWLAPEAPRQVCPRKPARVSRSSNVDAATRASAWAWLRRHDERDYSFVDATSFEVMRRLRMTEALAFDGDFAAAGFSELRPGERPGRQG